MWSAILRHFASHSSFSTCCWQLTIFIDHLPLTLKPLSSSTNYLDRNISQLVSIYQISWIFCSWQTKTITSLTSPPSISKPWCRTSQHAFLSNNSAVTYVSVVPVRFVESTETPQVFVSVVFRRQVSQALHNHVSSDIRQNDVRQVWLAVHQQGCSHMSTCLYAMLPIRTISMYRVAATQSA